MAIIYAPDYKFIVTKFEPITSMPMLGSRRVRATWEMNSMVSCQASLVTANGVGQLTATFGDPSLHIRRMGADAPHAMDQVQLYVKSAYNGQMMIAWTGFIDTVQKGMDPTVGDTITISATSPYKLWEITRQKPAGVIDVALSYANGVLGSVILQYSAKAVGYPADQLIIDPNADSGNFTVGQAGAQNFINPDQQTWSAVMQSLLADNGVEWFFTEDGSCRWRPIGYLQDAPYGGYRPILEDELFQADLRETDQGVVTYVEVRWGQVPFHLATGGPRWDAPLPMVQQLQARDLIVYAPWLTRQPQAQYLANILGQVYSSNLLQGSVTIPADPGFQIGTVAQIPTLQNYPGNNEFANKGLYYIATVNYNLEWNGPFLMTLGLTYGRRPDQTFPYPQGGSDFRLPHDSSSPLNTTPAPDADGNTRLVAPYTNGIQYSGYDGSNNFGLGNNPGVLKGTWKVVVDGTVADGEVRIDPQYISPGSLIQLTDADSNSAQDNIGNYPDYTATVKGTPVASGYVLYINNASVPSGVAKTASVISISTGINTSTVTPSLDPNTGNYAAPYNMFLDPGATTAPNAAIPGTATGDPLPYPIPSGSAGLNTPVPDGRVFALFPIQGYTMQTNSAESNGRTFVGNEHITQVFGKTDNSAEFHYYDRATQTFYTNPNAEFASELFAQLSQANVKKYSSPFHTGIDLGFSLGTVLQAMGEGVVATIHHAVAGNNYGVDYSADTVYKNPCLGNPGFTSFPVHAPILGSSNYMDIQDPEGAWEYLIHAYGGYGNGIAIYTPNQQYVYHYGHMDYDGFASGLVVGQTVRAGTVLGKIGSTGNSSGPHLHFEIFDVVNKYWIDPLPILQGLY